MGALDKFEALPFLRKGGAFFSDLLRMSGD